MAFFKFRNRGPQGSDGRLASAAGPTESVEAMRRRARHRLLGAGVLVLLGIIGFPLLFDTQPRPVAVDIPIEIPNRNKVKPLALPVARSTSSDMITETADGTEITASKPAEEPAPRPVAKPERKVEVKSKPKPVAPKPSVASTGDSSRAQALIDGKDSVSSVAPATGDDIKGRFVVQVGAFADPEKAIEARQKLERAGLKTYTHVAKTSDGERTRVRLGPFGTRAEADRAAGKVKGLSMPAAILSL